MYKRLKTASLNLMTIVKRSSLSVKKMNDTKFRCIQKKKKNDYIDDIIYVKSNLVFQKYNSNKSPKQMSQKYVMKI